MGRYDIPGLSVQELRQDTAGIEQSVAYVHSLIQAEVDAGTPSERIVVGGFSQGGAKPLRPLAPPAYSPALWAALLPCCHATAFGCLVVARAPLPLGREPEERGGRPTADWWRMGTAGCVALAAALSCEHQLGGVMALSTW